MGSCAREYRGTGERRDPAMIGVAELEGRFEPAALSGGEEGQGEAEIVFIFGACVFGFVEKLDFGSEAGDAKRAAADDAIERQANEFVPAAAEVPGGSV